MKLRPYQLAAIQQVLYLFPRRVCLTMPTGSGKTLTATALAQGLGKRTLWCVHRRELVEQAAGAFARLGMPVGYIQAGVREDRYARVQIASIQTLARRTPPDADLVVIDEAHHVRSATYEKTLALYAERGALLLGLTATPFRLDGRGLGQWFDEIVVGAWPDELVADGTLVDPLVYAPATPQLAGVRTVAGDYSQSQLADVVDKPKVVGDIVSHWQKLAPGKRTVAFAVSIDHSQHIVDAFQQAGVAAQHLDGTDSTERRKDILRRWRTGEVSLVSNVALFGEGFDLPHLECGILAQPTKSLCLHLQQVGRVCRSADGKDAAVILDHAGNHLRHGRMTDRITYSLTDRAVKSEGTALQRCPRCFVLHAPARVCPQCGYTRQREVDLPGMGGREVEQVDGELQMLRAPREGAGFAERAKFWADMERLRVEYGYKESFSAIRYKNMFGVWPSLVGGQLVEKMPAADQLPVSSEDNKKRDVYLQLLRDARAAGRKDGFAFHAYVRKFGERPPWSWRKLAETA